MKKITIFMMISLLTSSQAFAYSYYLEKHPVWDTSDIRTEDWEEKYISRIEDEHNYYLDRQKAFKGVEDNVLTYPYLHPNYSSNCSLDWNTDAVYDLLATGNRELVPEECYTEFTSIIHYPATGIDEVDKTIKEWVENSKTSQAQLLIYYLARPSPQYLSVGFRQLEYPIPERIYWTSLNFDLQDGKLLELNDFFPNVAYSEPLVADYILHKFFPYKGQKELIKMLKLTASRLILSEHGLYILYNNDRLFSYSDDIELGFIPVSDMEKLGGRTVFWQQ